MKFKSMAILLSCAFVYSGTAYGMENDQEEFEEHKALTQRFLGSFKKSGVPTPQVLENPEVLQMLRAAVQKNPGLREAIQGFLDFLKKYE